MIINFLVKKIVKALKESFNNDVENTFKDYNDKIDRNLNLTMQSIENRLDLFVSKYHEKLIEHTDVHTKNVEINFEKKFIEHLQPHFSQLVVKELSEFIRSEKGVEVLEEIKQNILLNKDILTVEELATYTGYKTKYIYQLVANKKIPYSKVESGNKLFFDRHKINKWLLENSIEVESNTNHE